MSIIFAGVGMFTAIVLALIAIILTARAETGQRRQHTHRHQQRSRARRSIASAGGKLLFTLAQRGVFLSSACGGGGTCGQCRVKILRRRRGRTADRDESPQQAPGSRGLATRVPGGREAGSEDRSAARVSRRQTLGMLRCLERQRRDVHQGTGAWRCPKARW